MAQAKLRVLAETVGWGATKPQDNEIHLAAAMAWLCTAQDTVKRGGVRDDGVAQTFLARSRTWAPSYPETTGYIIPTFYDYWRRSGDCDVRRRAVRMAEWECAVQHPDGGVLAGALGDSDQPTVFNTGQVLFGWVRAFEEENTEAYREAAVRAAAWLCAAQDDDGCWRRFASPMTQTTVNLYNTRTAWGLARVHAITGERRFLDAAVRNIDWALARQQENGWFPDNCLTDDTQPFTHTIAYALRGILEVGAATTNARHLTAARRTADALAAAVPPNGLLPGRFDAAWHPTVRWCCLTGLAQVGIALGRLYQLTGEERYRSALRRGNRFLKTTQKLTGDADERGGIKGSHPINGGYHPWQYPNWAAKFFADALMLDDGLDAGYAPTG